MRTPRNFGSKTQVKILMMAICLLLPRMVEAGADEAMPARAVASDDTCECPKLACNVECERQTDLSFYSQKCAAGEKVKSCAKPTCVPLDNVPASCGVVKKTETAAQDRMPASATDKSVMAVGRVTFLEPQAWLTKMNGDKAELAIGTEIHEKDRVSTGDKGKVQIEFNSGNKLNVTANTEIAIQEASDSLPDLQKKRMILDLIKGKVRNSVKQKYDGVQSFYQIRTRAAVAGVRGTEFVASIEDSGAQYATKIETLEGRVELSDTPHNQKIFVAKNESASFVTDRATLFSNSEKADFVAKGYLTPVYKLKDEEIANLNRETDFDLKKSGEASKKRSTASEDAVNVANMPVCSSPSAQLNQCAWTCENNPAGEKTCRTDLQSVQCMRRICDANGKWSNPSRLPASFKDACRAEKPVVKDCDY